MSSRYTVPSGQEVLQVLVVASHAGAGERDGLGLSVVDGGGGNNPGTHGWTPVVHSSIDSGKIARGYPAERLRRLSSGATFMIPFRRGAESSLKCIMTQMRYASMWQHSMKHTK